MKMLERAPQLIAQEWIDGPDDAIFFALFTCGRDSNLTGLFLGRKLVCDPPEVGSTAVCVEAPEVADELRRLTKHFISRVRYRGLGSLEFKRDSRTGRFIIVEPTVGRTDWQEEIATLCGVNLPLITYWTELGQTAPADGAVGGPVAWRSTFEHRIPPGTLPSGTRVVDGFFRWADPLPAIYYYGLERFAARIVRRLTRSYRSPT